MYPHTLPTTAGRSPGEQDACPPSDPWCRVDIEAQDHHIVLTTSRTLTRLGLAQLLNRSLPAGVVLRVLAPIPDASEAVARVPLDATKEHLVANYQRTAELNAAILDLRGESPRTHAYSGRSAGCPTVMLTPRQRQIATLLGAGLSNKDIARELFLAPGTVKLHVAAVLRCLGVKRRAQVPALLNTTMSPVHADSEGFAS